MRNSFVFAALAVFLFAVMPMVASAQTFEKKHYNYSDWTKGRFSEAVTVIGPGKMIFLAGVGAENENGKAGDILHKGDFVAQYKYAYNKIKRALEKNGATLADVVRITTYLTDIRNQACECSTIERKRIDCTLDSRCALGAKHRFRELVILRANLVVAQRILRIPARDRRL